MWAHKLGTEWCMPLEVYKQTHVYYCITLNTLKNRNVQKLTVRESAVGSSSLSQRTFHFCGRCPSSVSNLWISSSRWENPSGTMQSTSSYLQLIISKHLFYVWNGGRDTWTNKYRTKKQQDIKHFPFWTAHFLRDIRYVWKLAIFTAAYIRYKIWYLTILTKHSVEFSYLYNSVHDSDISIMHFHITH
jgi:hypothetical protein